MKIDKLVCEFYGLSYRKITDKQVLQIQQLLVEEFGELKLLYDDGYTANEIIAWIPEDRHKKKPLNWDELPPENQGYGQTVREAILSLSVSQRVLDTSFLKDDIKYVLMNKLERIAAGL